MPVDQKKICLVIPSLQVDGMERVMSELAGYFCRKNDLEVHLVLYGIKPEIFYQVPENLIIHKPITAFNNKFRVLYTLGRLIYLRRTIKKIRPYSILSFGEYWNSFVLLALVGLSYPVYISDRCSPEITYSYFHDMLRRWLYPRAEGIVAQTEKARSLYYRQFSHENIAVIGNPIRGITSNNIPKEKIVLSVGRMIPSKKHDKLIEVFCEIGKPDWKLYIIGGDDPKYGMLDKLHKLVAQYQADSKVIFTGRQHNADKFYLMSSIFAFTSVSEGFPNVIGEAMSAALPVVAFDCVAGPSEMISDKETGYLVPVNDYSTFKMRLEQLMNDEALREKLGLKAKEAIRKFSVENIGSRYYDFIVAN